MTSHNETLIDFAKPKRIQQSCMTCVCSILEGWKEKCMSEIGFIMTKNKKLLNEPFWALHACQNTSKLLHIYCKSKFRKKNSKLNFQTYLGLAKFNSNDQFFYWHLICASKGSQYKLLGIKGAKCSKSFIWVPSPKSRQRTKPIRRSQKKYKDFVFILCL